MKKQILILTLGIALLLSSKLNAQSSKNATLQVTATVQSSPARITLNWATNQPSSTSYIIYKKTTSATSWGTAIATLSGTTFTYADNAVSVGNLYEYKIQRNTGTAPGYGASWGYVTSGINAPATTNRGTIILVIDNTFTSTLSSSINTYRQDLEGEGWFIRTYYVSRTATVTSIKSTIQTAYNISPSNTKAVVLIGHVPVPYSGNIAPDGHYGTGGHQGAHPADCYYADMDGVWTDATVNNNIAGDVRNRNVPGDGKFDQSNIPMNSSNTNNKVELEIGRIDMYDLPLFTNKTEIQLLQSYFERNHAYRTKATVYNNRALIDQGFSGYGEWAWLLSPMVGITNTFTGAYLPTLQNNSYLWSSRSGGGGWKNYHYAYGPHTRGDMVDGGIGSARYTSTKGLVDTAIKTVFTSIFGSWVGDWDHTNSMLRASLGSGALTCNWNAFPNWFYHPMGMDANIGYSYKITQNNTYNYYQPEGSYNGTVGQVHITLLGDPTLRSQVIAPPSNLNITYNASNYHALSWTASTEPGIAGYNIYRIRYAGPSGNVQTTYTKLNSTPVTATTYSACDNLNGMDKYVVRAVKLVTTPSGSFYLESTGIQKIINNWIWPDFWYSNSGLTVNFENYTWGMLQNYNSYDYNYYWEFYNDQYYNDWLGDAVVKNPIFTFPDYGTKLVTLYAYKGCRWESITYTFNLINAGPTLQDNTNTSVDNTTKPTNAIKLYPNPSNNGIFNILFKEDIGIAKYTIIDALGKQIKECDFSNLSVENQIDISSEAKGIYYILINSESKGQFKLKIINN